MELEFKGGNCVVIGSKKDTFVTDPNLSAIGLKDQGANATAVLLTQAAFKVATGDETLVIDGPGEYEVKNCSISGIAAKRHSELDEKALNATVYKLNLEDLSVVVLGHINPSLSDAQLEAIGLADVLVLPVGGNGYTLDAKSAVDLVRRIEPKVVIPTHYEAPGLSYEVPQQSVDEFIKELGVPAEEVAKLKLKAGALPTGLTVYRLQMSK